MVPSDSRQASRNETPHKRNAAYPDRDGQYAASLVLQLELFRKGIHDGLPYAPLMHHVAIRLTPRQMRDAAASYASLKLTTPPPSAECR